MILRTSYYKEPIYITQDNLWYATKGFEFFHFSTFWNAEPYGFKTKDELINLLKSRHPDLQ